MTKCKRQGSSREIFPHTLKASHKNYKALKNSHKRKKDNTGSINDENTNIAMTVYDINNLEIVENHEVNATTNAENADAESMDIDNINMAEAEIDKNDDIAMSDNNDDNPIMSDKEGPLESPANDNIANDEVGEKSTEEVPSPLIYGRKTDDPTKVKSSKRCRPVKVTPLESPMGNPHVDKDATGTPSTYVFDPNDVRIHEFFFEGEPNGKDLEGIEEDKILEIHRAFEQKERDAERERNITKKIQEYVQKFDFINKALLESMAQITEMTKPDHSAATARVKSADKMVMLPPLFDGTKPEVAKQHYERSNQYIKFQMKLAKGTAVPSLYSHIAHSNDKDETEIPQPLKGAHPKQLKPRGRGKGKQPQQKLKAPPPQTQDDQYNYEDINNYYHNENYRGQSKDRRPYRGQNAGCSFRGQNFLVAEVKETRTHTKANIKMMAIKAIITRVIKDFIIIHIEISLKVIATDNLEAEAVAEAEAIITAVVKVGLIIEAMLIINIISIMVMMMSTRQTNMVHHVLYAVAIITLPNIVLKGSMTSMTLWKR